jgi:hypothetical protein
MKMEEVLLRDSKALLVFAGDIDRVKEMRDSLCEFVKIRWGVKVRVELFTMIHTRKQAYNIHHSTASYAWIYVSEEQKCPFCRSLDIRSHRYQVCLAPVQDLRTPGADAYRGRSPE